MKSRSIHFLLLFSVFYWASGIARGVHLALDHARPCSSVCDDDDDDDCGATPATPAPPSAGDRGQPVRDQPHHPCAVCQMLLGMTATAPPVVTPPLLTWPLCQTRVLGDVIALHLSTDRPGDARAPPRSLLLHI